MQITSGKIPTAKRVVIYGPEGIGKSSLAAAFPNPVFIDVEGSTEDMDVKRLPKPLSWIMLLETVTYARQNPSVGATLVIDTIDWAEALCISHVCATHHWEGIEDPGYGKGYTYLVEEFGRLLNLLSEVAERGVNVVLLAHAEIKKFEQPDEATPYDRWQLKLQKKNAALTREWAKMVLFANYKTFAVRDEKTKKVTASGGKRVLYTEHRPAWDAKNRDSLPSEIPFEGANGLPAELAAILPVLTVANETDPEVQAAKAQVAVTPQEEREHAERAENRVHGGTDKTDAELIAEAPAPTRDSAPTVNVPLHVAKLLQLMDASGVEESEVRAAVHAKGYFPLTTPIEKYPAEFVEGALIGAWPKVLAAINASKQTSLDAPTPFDN